MKKIKEQTEPQASTIKVDFRQVLVETEFDQFEPCNLGKTVGNHIHRGCGDLDQDEIARTIHKTGEADIPLSMVNDIRAIIKAAPIVYAYKCAILEQLPYQNQTEA